MATTTREDEESNPSENHRQSVQTEIHQLQILLDDSSTITSYQIELSIGNASKNNLEYRTPNF